MAEILWDAPVPPDTLSSYLEKYVPAPAQNTLTGLASVNYTSDDKVRWGTITRKNRYARYRAYDGAIARTVRDAAEDRWLSLAPFSNSLVNGEYATLKKEHARLGGSNMAVLEDAIYNDGETLMTTMWNRVELALGTAMLGKFEVNENRTRLEVDYGIPAANQIGAATAWTDITALAADDLRAMVAQSMRASGVRPGRIVTSQAVVSALLRNVQVVSEAIGVMTGRTRITRAELSAWLASEQLPQIVTEVEGIMEDEETGQQVRVFPEDKIVLAPAQLSDVLTFTFGLSATALRLIQSARTDFSFGDQVRVAGMVVVDGPPFREYTYTDAVGMPILSAPERVVVGTVL